jgi:hypothetical protein
MKSRRMSGMAMVVVLGIVIVLSVVVAFAITLSDRERRETGKLVHNITIQDMTESTLQRARGYFAVNYGLNGSGWNTYLAYFVSNPVILTPTGSQGPTLAQVTTSLASLNTAHPELMRCGPGGSCANIDPKMLAGYTCYMYLRDNADEFPPLANNPSQDNDLLVYVGAVCIETQQRAGSLSTTPLIAELTAPLLYNPTAAQYSNQASGGTQGLNNMSVTPGYR